MTAPTPESRVLPLLPLRDVVVFPHMVIPLFVGRPKSIDIEQVKWVVLMVLFSQPGQEQAYERLEDLVFEERRDAMH